MNPFSIYFIEWYKAEYGKEPDPADAETIKLNEAYKTGYQDGYDNGYDDRAKV